MTIELWTCETGKARPGANWKHRFELSYLSEEML